MLRRIEIIALVLLVVAGVVSYVDRATLAFANPLIRHDLGLGVAPMGWLLSAFLWAYAFAQLPAGALVDRVGPRRMLSGGLVLWSVAEACGGAATGIGVFFVARMGLGFGEAPVSPASARVTRDWFARASRGTATGIWNCSSTLGTAVAGPVVTALMTAFGWRAMFAIMGGAGLTVAALVYALHRDPREVALPPADRARLAAGDDPAERADPVTLAEWRRLFGTRTAWGMIAGFFGVIYVLWIYNTWLPAYLEMSFHVSIRRTGWIASVPFAFGVVGSLAGGALVDWLVRRGMSPINSRRLPMAAALVLTALCTVVAAETARLGVALSAISVALFLIYVSTSTAWAMPSVAAPANVTASLGAMQNFGGYVGGALAPTLTGITVQRTGSFHVAFLLGAAIAVVAAVLHLLLVRGPVPATPAGAPRR